MHLKESKKGYIGESEWRKRKGEVMFLYYHIKVSEKNKTKQITTNKKLKASLSLSAEQKLPF